MNYGLPKKKPVLEGAGIDLYLHMYILVYIHVYRAYMIHLHRYIIVYTCICIQINYMMSSVDLAVPSQAIVPQGI